MSEARRISEHTQAVDSALYAALDCLLWTGYTCDGDGQETDNLDNLFSIEDFGADEVASLRAELESFMEACAVDLTETDMEPAQIGHDFILTRNGHGAGFWDRGLGAAGKRLTEACRPYGELNASTEDGKLYLE